MTPDIKELIFDPSAIDFKTPPSFKTDITEPTKYLKAVWAYSTTIELVCGKCGSMFSRSYIWETHFEPMLELQTKNNTHPLRDLDGWKDLLYFECPDCGESGDIEYDSANPDFEKIGYTAEFNPEIDSSTSKSKSDRTINVNSSEDENPVMVDDRNNR